MFKKIKSANSIKSFLAADLTQIKELLHPKNDSFPLDFSLALGGLDVGGSSLPHKLTKNCEVYYFIKGSGRISLGGKYSPIKKGDVAYVPAEEIQFIENTGNGQLEFLCIVSPPWSSDEEEILGNQEECKLPTHP